MSNVDLSESSTEIKHIGVMTKKCPYCGSVYTNKRKHFVVCPNRAHGQHRWTEEEKHRLSEKRKAFLRNNPDKHPWRMHRYDKFVSKPCEYLKNKLRELNIEFEEEVVMPQIGRNFSIDIFIPKLKMGIEVNGNQHYDSFGQLTPYYQERHDVIEQGGIKLIELPYTSCYHEETLESIELLWRNWNLNCLLNSKICEFESRQQYYVMKRSELKQCKDAEVKARYDTARREGKLNSLGRIQSNKTSISQWNTYKALIEESNVDITKFGWVKKVSQITGLTKRQIRNTVRKFDMTCFGRAAPSNICKAER